MVAQFVKETPTLATLEY